MDKFDRWQYNMSQEELEQAEADFKNSGLSEEEYCEKILNDIDSMFFASQENEKSEEEKEQAMKLYGLRGE